MEEGPNDDSRYYSIPSSTHAEDETNSKSLPKHDRKSDHLGVVGIVCVCVVVE